jgi:UDP-N-acetylglucosamine 2-epimerase (non-hydrolysing)
MIILVTGARPNFMKIAPLVRECKKLGLDHKIVHTGQHYDYRMSQTFFKDLELPEPDYFLGAGSGTHAEQTAKIMIEFERVCGTEKPIIIIVVGDVNSTLACSVTAKKMNISVGHVEAGLRSRDTSMPEEINRIVTDSISDYLFVTERSGIENLLREGKSEKQIYFVGNVMIDTLKYGLEKLTQMETKNPVRSRYAVVTLHRPSNVDEKEKLEDILSALKKIARDIAVYFPVHPRTEKNLDSFDLKHSLENANIQLIPPMPYLEFLGLWKDASIVLTDSGGLQEETTALGIPCLTLRDNTERPITVEVGTNILVGTDSESIIAAYEEFKKGNLKEGQIPKMWDGKASARIVEVLAAI